MSKIFIVGNGFDLNLGKPTSYLDFIKSSDFNVLLKDGNKLASLISKETQLLNWIDVEHFISKLTQTNPSDIDRRSFENLKSKLISYLKSIDGSIPEDKFFLKVLKKHFKKDDLVLNFNYTDFFRNSLKILGYSDDVLNERIKHVHGSLATDQIIFGIDDKIPVADHLAFLYKSFSSIFDPKNVVDAIDKVDEIIFMGYSIGTQDHMYFESLFTECVVGHLHSRKLTIYYYDEISQSILFNMVQILCGHRFSVFCLKNSCRFEKALA